MVSVPAKHDPEDDFLGEGATGEAEGTTEGALEGVAEGATDGEAEGVQIVPSPL